MITTEINLSTCGSVANRFAATQLSVEYCGGQANSSCTLTLSTSCCRWQELINGRRVPSDAPDYGNLMAMGAKQRVKAASTCSQHAAAGCVDL